ncbi:hypothetical protein [Peribacillus frigoritolerans]|uniref:hypothetical protein n=1 Tax=Peribacillus frigoritolerans TaxID=450367 RepID=UPI001F4F52F0|nr:hypothetical protein [Peribacillus frigoritolerans]MCK2019894.1 hypothetical protein [Peribacillus frigoritolerans]
MDTWKDAFWLAKMEWKKSWIGIFSLFFILLAVAVMYTVVWNDGDKLPSIFIDIAFLLLFGLVPYMVRSKELQYQKLDGEIWGSPFFMMLNTLPIDKEVLMKSRLVQALFPGLPFQLLFLILFSPMLLESMDILEYIAFMLIWLVFGVASAFTYAASDVGDRITPMMLLVWSIIIYGGVTLILVWFYVKTDTGIVGLSMEAAKAFPIWSMAVSGVIAVSGYYYCKHYMVKKMKKIDYLK